MHQGARKIRVQSAATFAEGDLQTEQYGKHTFLNLSNLISHALQIAQLAVMPHNGQDSSMCNVDTYDRSVDCLTNTTNLLRKLNIQIESMALTVTKETVPVDEAELPTAVCPPPVAGPEVTKRNKDPFVQPKYDLQRCKF